MSKCSDLAALLGRSLLFIGNECSSWSIADFVHAAQYARSLGFEGIVPKRVNGTARWYVSAELLAQELRAVEAVGCKYVPFAYCYGPTVSSAQIITECSLLAEVQSVCHGVVVADMETEWNGKVDAAKLFASEMAKHAMGTLIISTWADPNEQTWQDVIHALHSQVDAWWPQQYDLWLAAQEQEFIRLGETCIQPTVNLDSSVGPNDPVAIVKEHVAKGVTTISVWEWGQVQQNSGLARAVTACMPQGEVMGTLNLSDVAQEFVQAPGNAWACTVIGHQYIVGNAMLDRYRVTTELFPLGGVSEMGYPLSNEVSIPGYPGVVGQRFDNGVWCFDPTLKFKPPKGAKGPIYALSIYEGVGIDPRLPALQQQVTDLQKQVTQEQQQVMTLQQQETILQQQVTTLKQELADCQKSNQGQEALAAVSQIKTIVAPF